MMLQDMSLSKHCPYDLEGLLSLSTKTIFEQKNHYDLREALEISAQKDNKPPTQTPL